MLKNDNSNLQTKFGVHITSNIFQNNPILKSPNQPPDLPTLKAYPTYTTPEKVVGSKLFR